MKFFVDTADIEAIRELRDIGLLDGVTTNPTLVARSGRDFKQVVGEICALLPGLPVSAEVAATDFETMMAEADVLAAIADNVVVKLPLTFPGLRATRHLADRNVRTNVTLCFSAAQALLAAKAGATYVSPFIGRLDDINTDGMQLIQDIRVIFDNYDFKTELLAASIRSVNHVSDAALAGADVATIPPEILKKLVSHPLTDKGLEAFVKDWESTGQSIL